MKILEFIGSCAWSLSVYNKNDQWKDKHNSNENNRRDLIEALTHKALRASAHNYGPNNGTIRKIDFAHILPIDWP